MRKAVALNWLAASDSANVEQALPLVGAEFQFLHGAKREPNWCGYKTKQPTVEDKVKCALSSFAVENADERTELAIVTTKSPDSRAWNSTEVKRIMKSGGWTLFRFDHLAGPVTGHYLLGIVDTPAGAKVGFASWYGKTSNF